MHPDRAAFLRAILADPDDQAPWRVFADWLDENGDPELATFFRTIMPPYRGKLPPPLPRHRWPAGIARPG